MKNIILSIVVSCFALFTACENDGDQITVSGLENPNLVTTESDIVLSKEVKESSVLAFTWNESELTLSDETVSLPVDVPGIQLEISNSSAFENREVLNADHNTVAISGGQLNTIAQNFGYTPGESTPMYFRVNAAYGDNTTPFYSNQVVVNVTSYFIDMTKGHILTKEKEESGFLLYSPNADGEYYGFTGSGAWSNWFLQEGDGAIWGNDNDGVNGTPFLISDNQSAWNFWYPNFGGCYFTTLSTSNHKWSATSIPTLNMTSGAATAEAVFDRATVTWTISVTTTADQATMKINCSDAKLYDITTGTDDAVAIAKELGFIPGGDGSLSIDWSAGAAGDFTFGVAGDYTLTLNLADPTHWNYEIKEGKIGTKEPLSKFLYLPGIDDGISGSWTFDNYLNLISEEDSTYSGVIHINSKYGYNMSLIDGEWDNVYKMGDVEGTLAFKGSANITAPEAGLYFIQADLKNLTYSHTAVGNELYLGGLNDVWNFDDVVLTQGETGIFTGTASISKTSTNGIQIYLEKENWDSYFGGSFSELSYKGANITDDQSLALGNYNVTVNLIEGTCSFVAQ